MGGEEITFIGAMEAKNYPIYCTMYHPEYQFIDYVGPGTWEKYGNRKNAAEITFRLSLLLNRAARENSNRINATHKQLVHEIDPDADELEIYPMGGGLLQYAFGWRGN